MPKYIGRRLDLGISKESTRGTPAASPTYWVPKRLFSHEDKVTKARSTLAYGSIVAEGNQSPVALKWAEGVIETDLLSESFGLFLLSLLGTVSTAGPTDSSYTHTFSIQEDNQHDSLTIWVEDPVSNDIQFKLAMLESLIIDSTPEDVVKLTINFQSKSSDDVSAQSPSYSSESKFVGRHLSFKIATDTSGLDAASTISLKSLRLTINKNLVRDHVLGTVQPEDIINQAMSIEGVIELNHESDTYKDLMLDGSYRAARIQIVNTDDTIGAGSVNPEFRLDLSRVDFEGWEATRPNDELATQQITFKALWDISNANVINDCRLVNAVTTY